MRGVPRPLQRDEAQQHPGNKLNQLTSTCTANLLSRWLLTSVALQHQNLALIPVRFYSIFLQKFSFVNSDFAWYLEKVVKSVGYGVCTSGSKVWLANMRPSASHQDKSKWSWFCDNYIPRFMVAGWVQPQEPNRYVQLMLSHLLILYICELLSCK